MAGLDKEETVTIVGAGKEVFLRFGSTRGFNQFMLLLFLYGIANLAVEHAVYCMGIGSITSMLVLLSFHRKPHIDRAPNS